MMQQYLSIGIILLAFMKMSFSLNKVYSSGLKNIPLGICCFVGFNANFKKHFILMTKFQNRIVYSCGESDDLKK